MRYSKELLKGGTPLLVMSVLDGKDLYGYRIIRELEVRSENVFQMSEGTLYPILHALEQEGCLKSDWRTVDGRRRTKAAASSPRRKRSFCLTRGM